ncbi:MAG: sodium:solute symporter [Hyphomonadaceae bacterium]|nr:sodium:solute symporter [Hyphomonadaceae bacterium]
MNFSILDWSVLGGYFAVVSALGVMLSQRSARSSKDFFLSRNGFPVVLIVFSVLATTQSAATFLGGPDFGFRKDYTYLAGNLGSILAAIVAACVLLPRFYAAGVMTVYDLLNKAFGPTAMRSAGAMYLLGRVFANGARLFMAALAVALIVFSNTHFISVALSSLFITFIALAFTFVGGLRSVVASDALQFAVYVGTAIFILIGLYQVLNLPLSDLLTAARNAPDGQDKLVVFDFSLDLTNPFTMLSIFTGVALLSIGSYGLDQDTTQRLLAAGSPQRAGRAIVIATVLAIPLTFVFLSIGQLLHIFYERPEVTGRETVDLELEGTTVFMRYILDELPSGIRGLAVTGVIAAAVSTLNSGLNSMAAVAVSDFYRPMTDEKPERHYVMVGQFAMFGFATVLFLMSCLCYFWQKSSDSPLLEFALAVMTFAYAGLLGVYGTVFFTNRGSTGSVVGGLIAGFVVMCLGERSIGGGLGIPESYTSLAFSWKLCVATLVSFAVTVSGNTRRPSSVPGAVPG